MTEAERHKVRGPWAGPAPPWIRAWRWRPRLGTPPRGGGVAIATRSILPRLLSQTTAGWLAVGRRVERDAPISLPTLAAVRGSARRETAAPKPTASPVRRHRSKG